MVGWILDKLYKEYEDKILELAEQVDTLQQQLHSVNIYYLEERRRADELVHKNRDLKCQVAVLRTDNEKLDNQLKRIEHHLFVSSNIIKE